MSSLRFIPAGGALVEVTTRTLQGRLLLRPDPQLNEIVRGLLARAQRLYLSDLGSDEPVGVCAFCFLSNHFHLLLRVRNAAELSRFMQYFNSNLAREVARRVDWRDHVWSRRYQAIVISDEPEAQERRLHYLLFQGVKEGLVAHPADWPGATSVEALLEAKGVEGPWFDRTQEFFARRRREDFGRLRYATREVMTLVPLPCWDGAAPGEQRSRVETMIEDIVAEGRVLRRGRPALGVDLVLRQRPHDRAQHSKRSPAPRFHAVSRQARRALYTAFRAFERVYRWAALRLRQGDRSAPFPIGSFPPALPFVGG